MSDVGGTAGLWFGFSLLTLFELVDLTASLIVYGARKKWGSKNQKDHNKNVKDKDIGV